jgi:hypothetical protein
MDRRLFFVSSSNWQDPSDLFSWLQEIDEEIAIHEPSEMFRFSQKEFDAARFKKIELNQLHWLQLDATSPFGELPDYIMMPCKDPNYNAIRKTIERFMPRNRIFTY